MRSIDVSYREKMGRRIESYIAADDWGSELQWRDIWRPAHGDACCEEGTEDDCSQYWIEREPAKETIRDRSKAHDKDLTVVSFVL